MADKTHWKKCVSPSDYIGACDFQDGEEKIVTVKAVRQGVSVKTADGESKHAVAYFAENVKPMILNVTNSKAITKAAGSPYFEDWAGCPIQLYVDPNVRAFGDIVSAVRVRPRRAVVKQAAKCEDCGGDILAAAGKGADYIAQGTKKTYGVSLCWNCACKRAAQAKEAENVDPE